MLTTIVASAQASLAAAEILFRYNYSSHALHLSIVCWEECSKYLLAYCRDHLSEEHFKARFRHVQKFALGSGLYFLSGGFSVIYSIQQLHESGAFKESEDGLAALVALSLDDAGWGNAEALSKVLIERLSGEMDPEQKVAFEKSYSDAERLRTESVYVDFDDELRLKGAPFMILETEVKQWLKNARLGVAIVTFLQSEHPDLKKLVSSMPEQIRADIERASEDLIQRMTRLPKSGATETSQEPTN